MRTGAVILAIGVFVALTACDGSRVLDPERRPWFQIRVVPDSVELTAGDSARFFVTVPGKPFFGSSSVDWFVRFNSDDPPHVSFDGAGFGTWLRGEGAGSGYVVARAGPGLTDSARIVIAAGPPDTVWVEQIPHALQQNVSYDLRGLFDAAVADGFGNRTSAEVHWSGDALQFTEETVRGVSPGTTSVAVGLSPDAPQDRDTLWVQPFTGTWADVAVAWTYILTTGTVECGLDTAGYASCRGPNESGQLGYYTPLIWVPLNDWAGRSEAYRRSDTRLPVDTDLRFRSIESGPRHTCALGEDGLAYCWGDPAMGGSPEGVGGSCGYGYMQPIMPCNFEPTPVREDLTFLEITATCGITPTGSLWCWDREVRQVFSDTPIRTFDGAGGGGCGLSTDGVAYCWGGNEWGQLGIGSADTLAHPEPEAVATALRFTDIASNASHACGIATDGSVHCWGAAESGRIGTTDALATCPGPADGDPGPCSPEPVRVDSEQTFERIEAGRSFTCGLTASGEGYCWGAVPYGETGPSPVRIPSDLSITALDNGPRSLCVGTADGELACWVSN